MLGWLIELKLIISKINILSFKEKRKVLYLGEKLNKYISSERLPGYIFNIPVRIPMIVPPKTKKYLQDGRIQLGGYLLNDVRYTEPLFIDNPNLVENWVI